MFCLSLVCQPILCFVNDRSRFDCSLVRIICLKFNYKEFSVPTYFVQVLLRGGAAVALGVVVAYLLHTSIDFGLLRLCIMMVVSPLSTLVLCICCALHNMNVVI